jgi:predicted Zn-dependent protease
MIMILKFKTSIVSLLFLFVCTQLNAQEKAGVNYDFDCYDIPANSITILSDFGAGVLNQFTDPISIADQQKVGDEFVEYYRENSTLDNNSSYKRKLTTILGKLVRNIRDPKGFKYEIYYIDDPVFNAFTIGGKIFVNKGAIEFCENDDELACIIGHEIMHNELGHCESSMKKFQLMDNMFGSSSSVATYVMKLFTDPFGQLDEAHCDMRGMDVAIAAGYRACYYRGLWERLAEQEGESDLFTKFLSSHPLHENRAKCVNNHLMNNYKTKCPQ